LLSRWAADEVEGKTLRAPLKLQMPDREPWSAYPSGAPPPAPAREVVILIPLEAPLRVGFEQARHALAEGHARVRVIGCGTTLRGNWPEWVPDAAGLALTELDAYLPCDRALLTKELADALRDWLALVFEGAIEAVPAERALWASAMLRLFHPAFASWPLVVGIAQVHRRDHVICTDSSWVGGDALSRLLSTTGGTFAYLAPPERKTGFPFRLAAWGAANVCVAVCARAYEYWKEHPSRSRLRILRSKASAAPGTWICLFGDWPRATRHVIEGVGHAARLRGERIGVLLYGSLQPGLRREDDMRRHTGSVIFPALEQPGLRGTIGAVDQCASVESVGELVANGASSILQSARVLVRIVQTGRIVKLAELSFDLLPRIPGLARLATFDVLRGNEAARATRALLRRRSLQNARVVFPHASLTTEAVPDLVLQGAGVTTYDFIHGSLYDALDIHTIGRTSSSLKVLWTEGEARIYAPLTSHQTSVGGYVPRVRSAIHRTLRARGGPRTARILALTNYVCGVPNGKKTFRMECYQYAFFEALSGAIRSCPRPVEVRWRPHPSDSRPLVQATAARHASLKMTLSLEPDALPEELAQADVVLTSISSTVAEALDYSVPILVHEIPFFDSAGVLSFFSSERLFSNADDLGPKLRRCLEALDSGSPDALRHEAQLERELFGPSGRPKPLDQLFWPS
jgi:hypothetical protein